MVPAKPQILAVAALVLLAGCGGSNDEASGPEGTEPAAAPTRQVRKAFLAEASCQRPRGASRWGCSIPDYRCQAVVTDRGWSVSCARPGDSVAFLVRR